MLSPEARPRSEISVLIPNLWKIVTHFVCGSPDTCKPINLLAESMFLPIACVLPIKKEHNWRNS